MTAIFQKTQGVKLVATIDDVKRLLDTTLQLGGRSSQMTAETPLLGNIPELDSMAVVTLITAIEEHFGFVVEDDEIDAEAFASLGALCDFVDRKLAS